MKTYTAAFQVLIKPGSYLVSKETLEYGQQQIDSEFDNSRNRMVN